MKQGNMFTINPTKLRLFVAGSLHRERRWFLDNPKAQKYCRPLTSEECARLGCPPPAELVGNRLRGGAIAWAIFICPQANGDQPPAARDAAS
jgi:hypothetical protein